MCNPYLRFPYNRTLKNNIQKYQNDWHQYFYRSTFRRSRSSQVRSKVGASSRWSFRSIPAGGSMETKAIMKKRSTLFVPFEGRWPCADSKPYNNIFRRLQRVTKNKAEFTAQVSIPKNVENGPLLVKDIKKKDFISFVMPSEGGYKVGIMKTILYIDVTGFHGPPKAVK